MMRKKKFSALRTSGVLFQLINWINKTTPETEAGSQVMVYFAEESVNGLYTKQETVINGKPTYKNTNDVYIIWFDNGVDDPFWSICTYIDQGGGNYALGDRWYESAEDTNYPYEVTIDGWLTRDGEFSPYVVFEEATFYTVSGTITKFTTGTPETITPANGWGVVTGIFVATVDVDGIYSLLVPSGYSGTLTAFEGYLDCTPASYSISSISGNLTDKDFLLEMDSGGGS